MGKRELLLVLCFIVIGVVVHQATAPPPGPDDRGLSLSGLLDKARREIRGNRARAETTTTVTVPIDQNVTELRLIDHLSAIQVTGEDRADIEATLQVQSRAYTEEEARQYADETRLDTDRVGSSVAMNVRYVKKRDSGRQSASLTIKVPARLTVRVESRPEALTVSNVAAVEASNSNGEVTIARVAGHVTMTHRGGSVTLEHVGSLKFTGRHTTLTLREVRGDTSVSMEQGELRASELAGPLAIESRHAEIRLDDLSPTRGPIQVNATGGSITLDRLRVETRIDGRHTDIAVTMGAAAPLTISNEGRDVALVPPAAGYRLEAIVVGGRITPETLLRGLGLELSTTEDGREVRATGPVNGGGPAITVRNTGGNLILRTSGT